MDGLHYPQAEHDPGEQVTIRLIFRGIKTDNDQALVKMKAGANRILVKVEQGGGDWKFCLRLLSMEQAAAVMGDSLEPTITHLPDLWPLQVRTDSEIRQGMPDHALVKVEVIAPGGRPVAEKEGPRGQVVDFNPAAWADGPYEIRCTTKTAVGRPLVAHLQWMKGNWKAAARQFIETAAKADPNTPDGMVLGMLGNMVRDRLGPRLDQYTLDTQRTVHSALMEAAEIDLAKAGAPGPLHGYGFVRLAWRDPVDDSPQFCRAYLPPDYSPGRKWPMVVSLHGYKPDNPPYFKSENVDLRHSVWADRYGVIYIEPNGRGNAGYEGFAEKDILTAIEEAKRRLSVDDDRVYLMGYSMGGAGTWTIGSHHPELFAALAPVYGGWDWHATTSDADAARLTPGQRFSREKESSFVQAESLLHMPILVTHGDADDAVPVENSRYVVRMLQRWGYDIRYHEYPGVGHGATGWCEDKIIPWLLEHKREAAPTHVRLRSPDLSTASAQWVQVRQCANPRK